MQRSDYIISRSSYHFVVGGVVFAVGFITNIFQGLTLNGFILTLITAMVATASVYLFISRNLDKLLHSFKSGHAFRGLQRLEGPFYRIYEAHRNLLYGFGKEREYYEKLYREYSEVLNSIDAGVLTLNGLQNIKMANESLREIFLFTSKEIKNISFSRFLRKTGMKIPLVQGKYEVYTKKFGKRFIVSVIDMDAEGWLITFMDITAQWQTKRLLDRTKRYAVDSQTIADFTHALKQPLANVQLSMDLYRKTGKEKYMDKMSIELKSFQEKVRSILQIYRHGEEAEEIELANLLFKVLKSMEPVAKTRGVVIEKIRIDKATVNVQIPRLENVLKNLMMNSIEATEGGRIKIKLRAGIDTATLIISDNGNGMNADVMSKAFKPFYTTKQGGSGLGLYLAKTFSEDNGVQLCLRTKENFGTFFSLTFRRLK